MTLYLAIAFGEDLFAIDSNRVFAAPVLSLTEADDAV